MEVDYDFCKTSNLCARDLLVWLDLDQYEDCDGYYHNVFNRNIMVFEQQNALRVSCTLDKFDRWSNSEEMWINLNVKSERVLFVEWVESQREAGGE